MTTPELLPTMAVDFRTTEALARHQQIAELGKQGWVFLQFIGKIALFMKESESDTAERIAREERERQASVAGMHASLVRKTERPKEAGYVD